MDTTFFSSVEISTATRTLYISISTTGSYFASSAIWNVANWTEWGIALLDSQGNQFDLKPFGITATRREGVYDDDIPRNGYDSDDPFIMSTWTLGELTWNRPSDFTVYIDYQAHDGTPRTRPKWYEIPVPTDYIPTAFMDQMGQYPITLPNPSPNPDSAPIDNAGNTPDTARQINLGSTSANFAASVSKNSDTDE